MDVPQTTHAVHRDTQTVLGQIKTNTNTPRSTRPKSRILFAILAS